MILKEHKKHSALARPAYGTFARQEWAILGAPCNAIKTLSDAVIQALSGEYSCGYIDARHTQDSEEASLPGRLASGAALEYTDQIHYHRFELKQAMPPSQFRQIFAELDVVLVNGNHQQAKAQVVILDSTKQASLQKRLAQLTDVQLFLLADNVPGVFDFVKEALPDWQQIPLYRLNETDKIITFFQNRLALARPVLHGLVLAGGQSLRMGQDKSAMQWHGKEQRYFMADLLESFCEEVFISCRLEQQANVDGHYKVLPDTFTGLGPYGAILSAFRERPDAAWLVVACDLPLLNEATLQQLTGSRKASAIATTFESPHDGLPEPLITIWEPKSYPVLLSFLAQGITCPRKVLRNGSTNIIQPLHPESLTNVNTPAEVEHVQQTLQLNSATAHVR